MGMVCSGTRGCVSGTISGVGEWVSTSILIGEPFGDFSFTFLGWRALSRLGKGSGSRAGLVALGMVGGDRKAVREGIGTEGGALTNPYLLPFRSIHESN